MASKADIEGVARAIGRARKRMDAVAPVPDPQRAHDELLIERIAEELAAEFPAAVAKLERDGHGGAERIETLIDVEMMSP